MSNALNNLIYGNQKIMDFTILTREGATDLNRKTSLNPNIVYKTYTGEATHKALNSDRQKQT